ncbi:MAG TPA: hypothetical protein VMB91_00615, partial [Solirubrobacteraceae bacterium]|nr:hypothetical protein [Solirubrobacteraceae bacterium]
FGIADPTAEETPPPDRPAGSPERPVHDELAALGSQLRAIESRLGELAERARGAEATRPP